MAKKIKVSEVLIERLIFLSGGLLFFFLLLIFVFLLKDSIPFFFKYPFKEFLTGIHWYPISDPPKFGILPILLGSIYVTLLSSIISIPLGISAAIYLAEIAPPKLSEILKPIIELLASIPSVVIGFIGIITIVPLIKKIFNLSTGLTILTGSITLAVMAIPTIVSMSEDAISSVSKTYKEASYSLGASKWQTIKKVVIPSALSGIVAASMLGVGRVIGETMAVMMVTGNAAVIPKNLLRPARTMTATIAAEMGETVFGSLHYNALFVIGLVLFLITFLINFLASLFISRIRREEVI